MRFENELEVAGRPADVLDILADVPLVASFLPGASAGSPNADGSHPGTLVVAFGPKRLTFKGNLTNTVDRETLSGVLSGSANSDVRGARMAVKMSYSLTQAGAPNAPSTTLRFVSEAQLGGVLAEFANTGGVAVMNVLLAEFAQRLSAHVASRQTDSAVPAAQPSAQTPVPAPALSAVRLLFSILRAKLRGLAKSLASMVGAGGTRP